MDVLTTGWGSRAVRPGRAQRIGVGVAVALGAFVLTLVALSGLHEEGDRPLDGLGVVLAAAASLPLVASRRFPLAGFVAAALASSTLAALGYPPGPPVGPTVALFFLGLRPADSPGGRRLAAVAVAALYAVHIGALALGQDGDPPVVEPLFGVIVWGGAWVIGDRVRLRRERMAALAERAHRAEREAERERRLAAAEERMRIARDLHDSAGHAINVILVQAGAARLHATSDPERARAALATIEDLARETVTEIDRLVGGLREDGAGEGLETPTSLAAAGALVERQRSGGLDVGLEVRGVERTLPHAVDAAAYRILQEALTNAAKHGGGPVRVEVAYGPAALTLSVTNPVRGDAEPGAPGHGLVGMRERAALLGGRLEAGAEDGVFAVRAELPCTESR